MFLREQIHVYAIKTTRENIVNMYDEQDKLTKYSNGKSGRRWTGKKYHGHYSLSQNNNVGEIFSFKYL